VITKTFSHTLHLGTFRKFLAKSWRSYKIFRCRMRGYHTCRNRRTWSKGTVDGYLPKKEPGVFAFRERTFKLPPEGGLFLSPEGVRYSEFGKVFPFYRHGCLGRRIRGRETPWAFPGPRCHQYKLHLFWPETGLERRTLRVKIGGPALSHQLDHGERFRNTIIGSRIIPQPRVTSKHQNAFMQQQPKLCDNKQSR